MQLPAIFRAVTASDRDLVILGHSMVIPAAVITHLWMSVRSSPAFPSCFMPAESEPLAAPPLQ